MCYQRVCVCVACVVINATMGAYAYKNTISKHIPHSHACMHTNRMRSLINHLMISEHHANMMHKYI